ncbi:MAG: energy transducer TonB [Flavobacteriales bacterium]|nr:MAG: energy transducer TonB [Flavobacteriales bacterium]
MELKKNPQADVEKRKPLLFSMGLVAAFAAVLLAFEWKTFEDDFSQLGQMLVLNEEEEMMPITRQEIKPPPPPPPKPTQIEVVEDEEEIEDEVELDDMEIDEDTEVEIQEIEEVVDEPQIFTIVEQMPSFPGGEAELFKYLGKTIKYPAMAKDAGISGIVYVTFVVYESGSIKDVKVLRGIGGGCDEEALRVIKNMPKWKAGKQRGKPVRVQFNLPIRFTLR